ncbi:hypothetical protein NAB35_00170 [Proteus mirabilis]|nr:hypothetical protein [Proteus mirabilis]
MSADNEQKKKELIEFFEKEKEKYRSNFLSKTCGVMQSFISGVKQVTQFRNDLIEYLDGNEVLRLVEFFYGINYKDNPNMLLALGPEYAEQIIDYVMKDTENDKLEYYINLTLNIANSRFTIKERRDVVNILKSLTVYDIQLAKRYYIYNKYELKGFKNRDEQLISLLPKDNGLSLKSTNNLLSNGLLFNNSTLNIIKYEITDFLEDFILLIHEKESSILIGLDVCEKDRFDVIFGFEKIKLDKDNLKLIEDSFVSSFADKLNALFKDKSIKYNVINDLDWELIRRSIYSDFLVKIIFTEDYSKYCLRYLSDEYFSQRNKINDNEDDICSFDKEDEKSICEVLSNIEYSILEPIYEERQNFNE